MLRLDDPTDNRGLGWKRLSVEDLAGLIYIGLKLLRRSRRLGLTDRNAVKSDASAKAAATELAERLRNYPVFGPARPAGGPTCGSTRADSDQP